MTPTTRGDRGVTRLLSRARWIARAGLLFAALFGSTSTARAEVTAGPRLGYNFDADRALLGGEVRFDLARLGNNVWLEGRPSLDLYPGRGAMFFQFSFDTLFAVATNSGIEPYGGPGLALVAGRGYSDLALNLAGGVLFNARRSVQPFVEVRGTVGGPSFACVLGGLALRL